MDGGAAAAQGGSPQAGAAEGSGGAAASAVEKRGRRDRTPDPARAAAQAAIDAKVNTILRAMPTHNRETVAKGARGGTTRKNFIKQWTHN